MSSLLLRTSSCRGLIASGRHPFLGRGHFSTTSSETSQEKRLLSPAQLADFQRNGFLVVKDMFSSEEKNRIFRAVCDDVQNWGLRKGSMRVGDGVQELAEGVKMYRS